MRKIYVESSCMTNPYTGIGKTINNLVNSLKEIGEDVITISFNDSEEKNEFLYYNSFLPKYCKRNLNNEDIFLIPNNLSKFWRLPHSNTWVIMHDVIPLSKYGYSRIKKIPYRIKLKLLKKASRIITISEYVKKNLIDLGLANGCDISVLYWSFEKSIFPESTTCLDLPDNYFIGIGTGEKRKCIDFVIKNWQPLAADNTHLLLFGGEAYPGAQKKLQSLIQDYDLSTHIHLLGKISETKLFHLYKHAKGLIFSSEEEGFGLPPLEALSVNTPVVMPATPINFELYKEIALFYSLGQKEQFYKACKMAQNIKTMNWDYSDFLSKFSQQIFKEKLNQIFKI